MAATTKTLTKKAKGKAKPRTAKAKAARGAQVSVQGITPFLWYDGNAEEAARFYVSLFKRSKIHSVDPMAVRFELAGQEIVALNGGPQYTFTPAFSLLVSVKTQAQVDELWERLVSNGGKESMCGWLIDKYGLSWQIVPTRLMELISAEDRKAAGRAVEAMLTMKKIEIAVMEKAYRGK